MRNAAPFWLLAATLLPSCVPTPAPIPPPPPLPAPPAPIPALPPAPPKDVHYNWLLRENNIRADFRPGTPTPSAKASLESLDGIWALLGDHERELISLEFGPPGSYQPQPQRFADGICRLKTNSSERLLFIRIDPENNEVWLSETGEPPPTPVKAWLLPVDDLLAFQGTIAGYEIDSVFVRLPSKERVLSREGTTELLSQRELPGSANGVEVISLRAQAAAGPVLIEKVPHYEFLGSWEAQSEGTTLTIEFREHHRIATVSCKREGEEFERGHVLWRWDSDLGTVIFQQDLQSLFEFTPKAEGIGLTLSNKRLYVRGVFQLPKHACVVDTTFSKVVDATLTR